MRTITMIMAFILAFGIIACTKEQATESSNDEYIISIKHLAYYPEPIFEKGFESELIIDSTNGRLISRYLSPKQTLDTNFNITLERWNSLVNSVDIQRLFLLDSIYDYANIVDGLVINLSIATNLRQKVILVLDTTITPVDIRELNIKLFNIKKEMGNEH